MAELCFIYARRKTQTANAQGRLSVISNSTESNFNDARTAQKHKSKEL